MFGSRLIVNGAWVVGIVMGLGFWAGCGAVAAEPVKPIVTGAEGERAFADLAKFYQDEKAQPPVEQAIKDMELADATKRAEAGKYLLALLAQSLADESNGRGNWRRTPFWGGGPESDARQFRQSLAAKLADQAKAPEILDAALWLVQGDKLVENQKHGVTLLCRIQSPQSVDIFRKLLAPPHPSQAVLVAVIEEAGRRKLIPLAADVRPLCVHYRTPVRLAACNTVKALGVSDLPEYRPEDAFTPWLDGQLKDIAKMIEGGVPKDAEMVQVHRHPSQTGPERQRLRAVLSGLAAERRQGAHRSPQRLRAAGATCQAADQDRTIHTPRAGQSPTGSS